MKSETVKRLNDFISSTDEDIDDIQLDFDEANEVLKLQVDYDKLKDYFQDMLSNTAFTPHEKIELLRAVLTINDQK